MNRKPGATTALLRRGRRPGVWGSPQWINSLGPRKRGPKQRFEPLAWSQQGMILRLPDYESGALTN